MGRAFKQYYNKHSNQSLQDGKRSIIEDKTRLSLIQKCLDVPVTPPPPPPPPQVETPPPTPKVETTEPKTDEELQDYYYHMRIQHQKESEVLYFQWLETLPSTWEKRILDLEFQRQKFNQKAGWSAGDLHEVEEIDKDIEFCSRKLQELLDSDEFWSDSDTDSDC